MAYTTFLCLLACAGIFAAVLLRACANPAVAGAGLAIQFFYGIAVIQGQFVWPAKLLWRDVRSSPVLCQERAAPSAV